MKKKRMNFMDDEEEEEIGVGKKYFDKQEIHDHQQEEMEYMKNLLENENIYEYDSIYSDIKNQKV
jgi:hypothetical protein